VTDSDRPTDRMALTHSLTHSQRHSLTHSLTHCECEGVWAWEWPRTQLTHSPTHPLTHSPTATSPALPRTLPRSLHFTSLDSCNVHFMYAISVHIRSIGLYSANQSSVEGCVHRMYGMRAYTHRCPLFARRNVAVIRIVWSSSYSVISKTWNPI